MSELENFRKTIDLSDELYALLEGLDYEDINPAMWRQLRNIRRCLRKDLAELERLHGRDAGRIVVL